MAEGPKEYLVGTVRPTNRPETGQELDLDSLIPAKIKFVSLTMNFTRGTEEEFSTSMPGYEAKAAELAKIGADLVRPSGAPPFMLLGYQKEQELISSWEKKYGVQMFTSGQNHVHALRTLGIRKFVGASYFPENMNDIFARYFTDAGFQVLAMEGIDAPFAAVPKVTAGANSGFHEAHRRQAQGRGRHLHARLRLENCRHHRPFRKRNQPNRRPRGSRALLGNTATFGFAPSDPRLRKIIG
jgi:Arylmalonate decarboxylase